MEAIYNSNIALLVAWKLKWNGYMHIAQILCLISIYLLWQPNNTNVTRKPPLPEPLCLPEEYVGHRVSMTCAMILLCPSGSSWSRETPTTVACIYSLN